MSGKYDDILHLPHPTSAKHPRMPISERAAIFSPFAALSGHAGEVTVIWFQPDERKDGGSYVTTVGRAKKIDEFKRILSMVGGQEIVLDDIVQIESQLLYDLP